MACDSVLKGLVFCGSTWVHILKSTVLYLRKPLILEWHDLKYSIYMETVFNFCIEKKMNWS